MSTQFGIWRPGGGAVEEPELVELGEKTAHLAPDGISRVCRRNIGMGFQPFHTHERSKLDTQPLHMANGNMVTLDGRIDNHQELLEELEIADRNTADSVVIAAALRRWGADAFRRFVGDWAVAFWCDAERALYLARDHAGTRTLYFETASECVLWSTSLDTFFAHGETRKIEEAYVARYLACLPMRDLTPYRGIRAVPAAHYIVLNERGVARRPHWQWMAKEGIAYSSDTEYEEHFYALFRQSVERRTGPGAPILAELSGGMDSSSIVCVSDRMRSERGAQPRELLDTISYFDDAEPNWDERPYFSIVEARRGKTGVHLNLRIEERTFEAPAAALGRVRRLPGIDRYAAGREMRFEDAVGGRNYRVILSGIGGDELLGGVPTPMPELADLIVSCRFRKLASRAFGFCLTERCVFGKPA